MKSARSGFCIPHTEKSSYQAFRKLSQDPLSSKKNWAVGGNPAWYTTVPMRLPLTNTQ
jgi:hypothetical protein